MRPPSNQELIVHAKVGTLRIVTFGADSEPFHYCSDTFNRKPDGAVEITRQIKAKPGQDHIAISLTLENQSLDSSSS